MSLPTQNPARTTQVLSDITCQHASEIPNSIADEYGTFNEKSETNAPVFDCFYNEGGSGATKFTTDFKSVELTEIWMAVSAFTSAHGNTGRRRKTSFHSKDVLLMVLTVLKYGQHWNFTARLFGMKRNTFEQVMKTVWKLFPTTCMKNVCSVGRKDEPCNGVG